MGQIKAGQATVTSDSNVVSGVGTDWIDKVSPGQTFKVQGVFDDFVWG